MGNKNCVADGHTPHMSSFKIVNELNESLKLDLSQRCDTERCGRHRGYGVKHGKFVEGWEPWLTIEPKSTEIIKVSGRSGSAVNPVGWIQYTFNGGKTKMRISYEAAGWTSFQSCAYVAVTFSGAPPPKGVGRDCQCMEDEPFDSDVSPHRQFRIIVHRDAWRSNNVDAGVSVVHWERQLGSGLASLLTPLILQPAVLGCGIYLITDQTRVDGKQSLQAAWRTGAIFHALRFSHIIEAKEPDGFESALKELAKVLKKGPPIAELHFWCHGGTGGSVSCGGEDLKPEYFDPIRPFTTSKSAIWFRCCFTFAGDSGKGCAPCAEDADEATQFARQVMYHSGCRYVAGHTVEIGYTHKECFLFDDKSQKWNGPVEARGTPEETLASIFKI